jgi:hypothetical protein
MDIRVDRPVPIDESDNPLLAFIHVPKTGGSTLQAILQGTLMASRPTWQIDHPLEAREFLALSEEEQSRYYAVFGHMPLGLREHMTRPVIYITFLRDPVERILSAYAHHLRHPDEPQADVARAQGIGWTGNPSNVSVSCLADHDIVETPNESGVYWATTWPMTEEHLEQAKRNLETCAFIGIHEHYAHDVRQLTEIVGRRILVPSLLPREKVGHNRIRQNELTPEQIEAIREGNRLDIALYEHALRLRELWNGPVNPAYKRQENWRPLDLKWWRDDGSGVDEAVPFPANFKTPSEAWHYGAVSETLPLTEAATLRITAELVEGAVGFCLLSEDASGVLSEQRALSEGAGKETLFLTFKADQPAKLCIRNYDGDGLAGETKVHGVDYAAAC